MINLLEETPHALRLAAQLITAYALHKEAQENLEATVGGTTATAPNFAPPPIPPSNVVPFVPAPPVPPAPSATLPSMPSFTPPIPPTLQPPIIPPAPVPMAPQPANFAPTVPPAPGVTSPTASSTELDKAGMPFDARIHQKSRNKKKDGTWKIQKGIDPAVVTAVTQELHARMQNAAINTPPAAGASAPVSLPGTQAPAQGYPGAQAPIPPAPGTQTQFIPPPPPPGTEAQAPTAAQAQVMHQQTLPVPPAPSMGVPNASNAGVVSDVNGPLRVLVAKFTEARVKGRITADDVTAILMQAGAPSLQMLGTMSHLVPIVDAYLDATLATRPDPAS
jgi:hypothetical protein